MKKDRALAILFVGFGMIFLLMGTLAVISLKYLEITYNHINEIVHEHRHKSNLVIKMRIAARERTLHMQQMIIFDDSFVRDEEWMKFNARGAEFVRYREELMKMALSPEETRLLKEQGEITGQVVPLQMQIAELAQQDAVDEARTLLVEKGIPGQNKVFGKLGELMNAQEQELETSAAEAQTDYRQALTTLLGLAGAVIAVCLLIAVYTIRRTMRHAEMLEQKVRERTVDLNNANQEINTLNQKLQSENLRMGLELEVARKLQQMVLPTPEELADVKELDIAAFMEPATEVGGDYYDVLQHQGRVKIGIGDVTGHGLESGIFMLMVQMAVLTLMKEEAGDPKTYLEVINRAVCDNIKRMKIDKNMTLAILDYYQGTLCISGQHEEILLVRKNGEIERIETIDLGFPVGLRADIEQFIHNIEFHLENGDGIVLYTDGITEAHNTDKKMYGIERLCRVISQAWMGNSAADVKQQIINDVKLHLGAALAFDDITLLVLKRREVIA